MKKHQGLLECQTSVYTHARSQQWRSSMWWLTVQQFFSVATRKTGSVTGLRLRKANCRSLNVLMLLIEAIIEFCVLNTLALKTSKTLRLPETNWMCPFPPESKPTKQINARTIHRRLNLKTSGTERWKSSCKYGWRETGLPKLDNCWSGYRSARFLMFDFVLSYQKRFIKSSWVDLKTTCLTFWMSFWVVKNVSLNWVKLIRYLCSWNWCVEFIWKQLVWHLNVECRLESLKTFH